MKKIIFENKICLACGISFNRRILDNGRLEFIEDFVRRKFCSIECTPAKIIFEDKTCLQCGISFNRAISPDGRLERPTSYRRRKFCSHRCSDLFRSGPGSQPIRIYTKDKICIQCGISFNRERRPSGKLSTPGDFRARMFCSNECSGAYRSGSNHYAFKPEGTVRSDGYLYLSNRGRKLFHRVVMENHLGRLLEDWEIVHHIDENKKNNSIENLKVMTRSQHMILHIELRKIDRIGNYLHDERSYNRNFWHGGQSHGGIPSLERFKSSWPYSPHQYIESVEN